MSKALRRFVAIGLVVSGAGFGFTTGEAVAGGGGNGDCRPPDGTQEEWCGWESSCGGFCDAVSCASEDCPATVQNPEWGCMVCQLD